MDRRPTSTVSGLSRIVAAYDAHRHVVLFYSLMLTLVSAPLLAAFEVEGYALRVVLAMNLVASVLGLRHGRGRTALLLATAAAVTAQMLSASILAPVTSNASLLFWSVIALVAAAASARFVLEAETVELDHVYAAMSVYLLAGVFFGLSHWTIEQAWPGSYVAVAGRTGPMRLFDGIYFSFVSLTTVGYGDMVPVSDVARSLSMVESVSGQLYLAVMIARLVGAHLQSRSR
jgi:hypothetical protein